MEKYTITLGEMIENNVVIFDFEYPFYNPNYKKSFEEHFIEHFYFDEIGQETISRFKQRLKSKLNLIMPYWNKILLADNLEQRILDNYDVTETFKRSGKNILNSTNENTNKNLHTDNPVTKVDIDSIDYLTSITKDISNSNNDTIQDSEEEWERKMTGNIGIQTDADAVIKYWQSLRKIEEEIFKECDSLFMGVY